jgi:glycosyltransferase involved in cell wall biosynthesis
MKRLRILVLAPGSNPDSLSTALVGYAHSEALARLNAVTLVANGCHEAVLRRKPNPFIAIQPISTPWLDRIYGWIIQYVFKGDYGSHLLTALSYPFSVVFDWKAWRLLRPQIMAGEFDVVLRLLPVVPTLPSPFAFFLRRGPIPFVIGPINGGLPWPQGFSQAERQKEWISNLRNLYRILPFAKSTYRYAAAIIAGSSQTYAEFAAYRKKMFFVPENGLSRSLFDSATSRSPGDGKLELIYVGRLVPYKACDLALRGSAQLLRRDLARLTIVGDGPERQGLEQLAKSLGIEKVVTFCGWLNHSEAMQRLQKTDVLVFPSIREFGGGVVFEALALGVVPVVADFGGPGDIVHSGVGYKVALTNESDMVCHIEKLLLELESDRDLVSRLSQEGMKYARETLSWDGKAQFVTKILSWAIGKGPKPDLPPPKFLPQQYW